MRNVRRALHRGGGDKTEASSQMRCSLDAWEKFGGCALPLGLALACAVFTPCLHFGIAHSCTCCLCVQSKPWYCHSNSTLNQNKAICCLLSFTFLRKIGSAYRQRKAVLFKAAHSLCKWFSWPNCLHQVRRQTGGTPANFKLTNQSSANPGNAGNP